MIHQCTSFWSKKHFFLNAYKYFLNIYWCVCVHIYRYIYIYIYTYTYTYIYVYIYIYMHTYIHIYIIYIYIYTHTHTHTHTHTEHRYIMQTKTFILDAINLRIWLRNTSLVHEVWGTEVSFSCVLLVDIAVNLAFILLKVSVDWCLYSCSCMYITLYAIRTPDLLTHSLTNPPSGWNQLCLKIQIMFVFKGKEAMFHSLPRNQTPEPLFLVSFVFIAVWPDFDVHCFLRLSWVLFPRQRL